jgi:hypothetical protein
MNDDFWTLARHCYGYGSWNASFWFIGPEQGGSMTEVPVRAAAFRKLDQDADGLCDCCEFHREILHATGKDWCKQDALPPLQHTWHYLMMTLMSYQGTVTLQNPPRGAAREAYKHPFKKYQRDEWGRSNGKTCVIERSGVSARSFKESGTLRTLLSQVERDEFDDILLQRTAQITAQILKVGPEFVLIYSKSQHSYWADLRSKGSRVSESPNEIFRVGRTLVAFAESRGPNNPRPDPWFNLGQELQKHRTEKHTN